MVDGNVERVLAGVEGLRDIEREDGAADEFLGVLCIVERDGGVGADSLKLQEVALAFLGVEGKGLLIDGTAVQVAVAQLAVAVVVVEVVRDVDGCCDGIATYN